MIEMKRGDIVSIRSNTILSKFLSAITGKSSNHIGLAISNTMMIVALPLYGVDLIDIRKCCAYSIYRYRDMAGQSIADNAINGVVGYALDRVNKRYDQGLFIKIYLRLRYILRTGLNTQEEWFSTKIVLEAFKRVGYDLLPGRTGYSNVDEVINSKLLYKVGEYNV